MRPGLLAHVRLGSTGKNGTDHRGDASVKAEQPTAKGKGKFWEAVRTHGTVFFVYWATSWTVCLGPIYAAFHFELVPYDGMDLLYAVHADKVFNIGAWSKKWVDLAVAIEINEVCDWVRLPVIIATTPRMVLFWQKLRSSALRRRP